MVSEPSTSRSAQTHTGIPVGPAVANPKPASPRPYVRGETRPGDDLIFAAVADEEAGRVYGAKALVEDRWDLVQAPYLLTEVAHPPPESSSNSFRLVMGGGIRVSTSAWPADGS